jgi:hypothetical protein
METKSTFKFDHESVKIYDAFGMSKEFDKKCREIIHFSAISNHLMAEELFDDRADAPRSLTTLTGDLEKAISLCENQQEVYYVLFNFSQFHDIAIDSIAKHKMMTELTGIQKEKLDVMMKMMEIKLKEEAKEQSMGMISPMDMFNKIELVKQSKYNFEKYLGLISSNELINSISDKW